MPTPRSSPSLVFGTSIPSSEARGIVYSACRAHSFTSFSHTPYATYVSVAAGKDSRSDFAMVWAVVGFLGCGLGGSFSWFKDCDDAGDEGDAFDL